MALYNLDGTAAHFKTWSLQRRSSELNLKYNALISIKVNASRWHKHGLLTMFPCESMLKSLLNCVKHITPDIKKAAQCNNWGNIY